MFRSLQVVAVCLVGFAFATGGAVADEAVKEAQRLLSSLGYQPGPADGAIGKRTISAVEQFLSAGGQTFDGTIDEGELTALRMAAADLVPTLKFPGRLFDASHGEATHCNALAPSRFHEGASAYDALEPIAKLNDSVSVGGSPLWDQIDPWLKMVLTEAALYDTADDLAAGEHALGQLEKWAAAGAVLKTPVDNSYSGKGNRGGYRPSASAPVLDMENAAQLGYAVYYALAMLDGLPGDRLATVREWADQLTERFGGPIGDGIFSRSANGIWRLEGRPMLVKAILDGDEATYRDYVEAYYALIRKVISPSGALLKNANRGDRALHYQSQGLLAVAAVLDIVENQGGTIPADIEAKFHQAVTFMLDADRDNRVIIGLAKQGYNNSGDGSSPVRFYRDSGEHYWWMYYYLSKYPDTDNAARLRTMLSLYDTFERANLKMLATTWVPYPINCYRPFDMSAATVADAARLVEAKYPEVEDTTVQRITEKGTGGVTTDSKVEAKMVFVRESFRERNFVEYGVQVVALTLDGKATYVPSFSIFTDFSGSAEKARNLQLFRLVVKRGHLKGAGSNQASYLKCGALSAELDGGDEMLKLHVGPGADKNECLLSKMDEEDRATWSALLARFGDLIALAQPGDAASRVQELYALVK